MEEAAIHFKNRAEKYNRSSNWVEDRQLMEKMFELAEVGPDSLVLDLATGTGLVARQFHGRVARVTGLDISPAMVRHAEGYMDEIIFSPVEEMLFPDATFDACVCRQGLQFADLDRAIPEIHRVLKPGGRVVLCHLTAYGEEDRELAFRIQALRNPARRNYFMPADVSGRLSRQGFREVADFPYVSDESVNKWIDNGAIPVENMEGIRRLYREGDEAFRRIHSIRFTENDILDAMLFVIATGRK